MAQLCDVDYYAMLYIIKFCLGEAPDVFRFFRFDDRTLSTFSTSDMVLKFALINSIRKVRKSQWLTFLWLHFINPGHQILVRSKRFL